MEKQEKRRSIDLSVPGVFFVLFWFIGGCFVLVLGFFFFFCLPCFVFFCDRRHSRDEEGYGAAGR